MDNSSPQSAIYKKGTFLERLGAFIIDQIIIQILLVVLSFVLKQFHFQIPLLSFVFAALFSSLFIWRAGATPGKILMKLKVVTSSCQSVSFGYALLRESIGKLISGLLFSLGYFWVLIDRKNQAWHDKIAHTLVVKLDATGHLIPIPSEEPVTRKRKIVFALLYLVFGLPIAAVTVFLIVYLFFFRPFQIAGNAMNPNYVNGQYYLTSINFGTPQRGEVIIFKSPTNVNKDPIKRVIGLPGDTIMLQGGSVSLNGQLLDESKYLSPDVKTYAGAFLQEGQTVTVPDQEYIVLGDNRPYSSDSREWGFLPRKNIISKVAVCYWRCSESSSPH